MSKLQSTQTNPSFVWCIHDWEREDLFVGSRTLRIEGLRGQEPAQNTFHAESPREIHKAIDDQPRNVRFVGGSDGSFEYEKNARLLFHCQLQALCSCVPSHRRLSTDWLVLVSLWHHIESKQRQTHDSQRPLQRTFLLSGTRRLPRTPQARQDHSNGQRFEKQRAGETPPAGIAEQTSSTENVFQQKIDIIPKVFLSNLVSMDLS